MTASAGGPTSSDWLHHQSVCLWRKLQYFYHTPRASQDSPGLNIAFTTTTSSNPVSRPVSYTGLLQSFLQFDEKHPATAAGLDSSRLE